jgi:hypothetical protein
MLINPRVLQSDDRLHEDLAHDRELDEVVGLAVGVGPHVDEQGLPIDPGDEEGQGRPVHALEGTHDVARDIDHRSGVAHADERVGPAVLDELGPDPDGGGFLFPKGENALAHADRLRSVDDGQPGILEPGPFDLPADGAFEADEKDVDAEILGRAHGAGHGGLRAEIPPHCVDGDSHARDPGQSSVPSVTCRPL